MRHLNLSGPTVLTVEGRYNIEIYICIFFPAPYFCNGIYLPWALMGHRAPSMLRSKKLLSSNVIVFLSMYALSIQDHQWPTNVRAVGDGTGSDPPIAGDKIFPRFKEKLKNAATPPLYVAGQTPHRRRSFNLLVLQITKICTYFHIWPCTPSETIRYYGSIGWGSM